MIVNLLSQIALKILLLFCCNLMEDEERRFTVKAGWSLVEENANSEGLKQNPAFTT